MLTKEPPEVSGVAPLRVFVSSTFRDMEAERNQLVKHVFPELRKRYAERGVTFTEVDLRWGITDEQRAEGQLLPLCFAEIERCRPYFIGLLGERYGRPLGTVVADLLAAEPWLESYLDRSVTELEILYGALRAPQATPHAFFYFRDPGYLDHLPSNVDPSDFRCETPSQSARLRDLKDAVRASTFPTQHYPDPVSLGKFVLVDFMNLRDRLFPLGEQRSALEEDAQDHEFFAASRTRVFVRRGHYSERLDAHAAADTPPLLVTGEVGIGKSAVLANWALEYRRGNPASRLITHFVAASPRSAELATMIRRIVAELDARFDLQVDAPDDPAMLARAFAGVLHRAATRSRVVLLIDGVDQLEGASGISPLQWLPREMPSNIRLVMSTPPGPVLNEAIERGWTQLELELLDPRDRRTVLQRYLAQHGKVLPPILEALIAQTVQAANPLFLRTLLEELRLFGDHERLAERCRHYVTARDMPELYQWIFDRYETDYERDRPRLVRDSLCALWAARRGLTESELLQFLGEDWILPVPQAIWSPLHLATENALINRGGVIGFAHRAFREAIANRYLSSAVETAALHDELARYFSVEPLLVTLRLRKDSAPEARASRLADEIPWQLAQARQWHSLAAVLTDPAFLKFAASNYDLDIKSYWTQIEANSAIRMIDAYASVIAEPSVDPDLSRRVGRLLRDLGHPQQALEIFSALIEFHRARGGGEPLQSALTATAAIFKDLGDLDRAMAIYTEQGQFYRQETEGVSGSSAGVVRTNQTRLADSLGNQALILHARGETVDAMRLHRQAEAIFESLDDQDGLATSLASQAAILLDRRELREALSLYKREEQLRRTRGQQHMLALNLGNQGLVFKGLGDAMQAMALEKQMESICRGIGDRKGLQESLGNQALILEDQRDLHAAMTLHKDREAICRDLGDQEGLAASFHGQASIQYRFGDLQRADALYGEAERIYRHLGHRLGLSRTLNNRALILKQSGNFEEALALHQQVERICREMDDQDGLQASLGNQATVMAGRGDPLGALALHGQEEQICRRLGNLPDLAICLHNQGVLLSGLHDFGGAARKHAEEEQICSDVNNMAGVEVAIAHQAGTRQADGDLLGALAGYRRAAGIARALNNLEALQRDLRDESKILYELKDLNDVMTICDAREELCRTLKDQEGLADSLCLRGLVLKTRGDLNAALEVLQASEQICRRIGNQFLLQNSLGNQALVLQDRGDLEGAMTLHKEEENICRHHGFEKELEQCLLNQQLVHAARRAATVDPGPGLGRGWVSTPHPHADPDRAVRLNREHLEAMKHWSSLSFLKRLVTKKPEPPTGI